MIEMLNYGSGSEPGLRYDEGYFSITGVFGTSGREEGVLQDGFNCFWLLTVFSFTFVPKVGAGSTRAPKCIVGHYSTI